MGYIRSKKRNTQTYKKHIDPSPIIQYYIYIFETRDSIEIIYKKCKHLKIDIPPSYNKYRQLYMYRVEDPETVKMATALP